VPWGGAGTGFPVGTSGLAQVGNLAFIIPSGDTVGGTDPANILQASQSGATPVLTPGVYYFNSTVGPFVTGQWVLCAEQVLINFKGTGDAFRWVDTSNYNARTGSGGGILGRPIIDGSGAGAGSIGLHYGDILRFTFDVAVQNFSGAGDWGILADNQNFFTEETRGRAWLTNCAQHFGFNVGGALTSTNSFGYGDLDIEILAKQNQDGIVAQNGAVPYNGGIKLRGNFQGTPGANTSAVLRVTGTVPAGHPNAGGFSKILSTEFDIQAECSSATGGNAPQTINFGNLSGNSILGCKGILDFTQGSLAFAVTNWTATGAAGAFSFTGVIRGDFNLNNDTVGLGTAYSSATAGARSHGKSLLNVINGNLHVDNGDYFNSTLTGSITVNLNPGGSATLGGAQRKVVVIKQAAVGGPFTVTWPNNGAPTVTNCSVVWAGGVAPTMSAGASAVDVYYLDTYDGATWYGRAVQNVS
jgi:hypothetical protein